MNKQKNKNPPKTKSTQLSVSDCSTVKSMSLEFKRSDAFILRGLIRCAIAGLNEEAECGNPTALKEAIERFGPLR